MNIIDIMNEVFPDMLASGMKTQYSQMAECKNIYQNFPPWHKTKKSGLSSKGSRRMALLNGAKVLADEFSALTFSEQVDITINDETAQAYVFKALNKNGFWKNMPDFLSVVYAMGGGVLKVYADNMSPCIDYIDGENFVPTSWDGKGVIEGVFKSTIIKGDKVFTLLERHYLEQSCPCIENKLFLSDNQAELGDEVALDMLYADLEPIIKYDGIKDIQMFHSFKPRISNNVDTDSPLGISIFNNAKDTLEAIDIAFDSFSREFILGKKRIIVPTSCVRTVTDIDTGETTRYFDADDEVFVALKCDEENDLKITDNTTTLRIDEHVSAINSLLNILCFQTGLSAGTLSFSGSEGVKTATEIISRDSKTARTIKANKNLLSETLEGLVRSIIAVGIFYDELPNKDYDITIGFQDNIIIDDDTLIDRNIKLVDAGLKSKVRAVMEVNKCDEETAKLIITEIANEQNVTGLSLDSMLGGGENDTARTNED